MKFIRFFTCFLGLLFLHVPATIAQDLRIGIEQLAGQITKEYVDTRKLRLAVIDFPDLQGVTSDLGRFIASRLTTRLAQNPQFIVIERQRLGQVLTELRFSMSDLVDPTKAKQLGRMVGAEAILVGNVSDLGNQIDIDARLIEIESNRMLLGITATVSKDPTVAQLLSSGRTTPIGSTSGISPASPPSTTTKGIAKYQEFPKFRVEVEALQVSPQGEVTIFLNYINKTQGELLIGRLRDTLPSRSKIFMLDSVGNRYDFARSSGMDDVHWRGNSPLTIGAGMRATASFVFRSRETRENMGKVFSFSSEQVVVRKAIDPHNNTIYKPESTHNISIRNIEPH